MSELEITPCEIGREVEKAASDCRSKAAKVPRCEIAYLQAALELTRIARRHGIACPKCQAEEAVRAAKDVA